MKFITYGPVNRTILETHEIFSVMAMNIVKAYLYLNRIQKLPAELYVSITFVKEEIENLTRDSL